MPTPAPIKQVCSKCIKSKGGKPYPPIWYYCDNGANPQNWPTSSENVPYFNSGNNMTGFVKQTGPDSLVSVGGVISSQGIPFVGHGTFYTFPITVLGDFTASFDIFPSVEGSVINFYWAILDADLLRGANLGYQGNTFAGQKESLFGTACNYLAALDGYDRVRVDGPLIANEQWSSFTLKRVGAVLTTYINGEVGLFYDFGTTFGMKLGLNFVTDSSVLSFRNISVVSP